jgi:hypothetical protein
LRLVVELELREGGGFRGAFVGALRGAAAGNAPAVSAP